VGVLITTRADSKRLPHKYREPIGEDTLLTRVFDRALAAGFPTNVVHPGDNLYEFCSQWEITDIGCPPDDRDVTRQLLEAATKAELDIIVLVTGDCAFVSPKVIKDAVHAFVGCRPYEGSKCRTRHEADMIFFGPDTQGMFVRVLTREALKKADDALREHREHGVTFLGNLHQTFNPLFVDMRWVGMKWINLSVDTEEDLALTREIYRRLPWDAEWPEVQECASEILMSRQTQLTSSPKLDPTTQGEETSPSS